MSVVSRVESGSGERNDVTHASIHESYVLEKCRSALIYRKSRDLECRKIDILQFTPESITEKICSS